MKVRIPQGMGGGNMQSMLKQAQKMQEDMAAKQAELEAREYEIQAGGGVVNVKINGRKEILSVKLAEEIVDPDDIETLEDLIVAGVNEAIKKVEADASAEMSKLTGGMNIPGMNGLF
ncbi:MAG: YbaB/EbfC family nucleoid-associated protein [Clostridia bacterium]|nr:YbaB/EbfC family nucleoid-associated protein [Clostridia bacterium]